MATYEKNDFEDASVGIRTTVEFELILKFIHIYNREKSLGASNGLSESQFAEYVCRKAGLNSANAQAYLNRAKALNQNHRVGEVPSESDEKNLCDDFRAYATAEIDAKAKAKADIDKKIDEEKSYIADYKKAERTVKNARRSVWAPFAMWGAIGLAGTIVLTAVLPAIAGITMLGGVYTTGFAGLATLVTGAIGGFRGLFGEGGRLKKYQDAKDSLGNKRKPKLTELEDEKSKLEMELNTLEKTNLKGKEGVSSRLYTMVANDKIEFKNEIENIYNSVLAGNTGYLTAGLGKGESDRVKAEKKTIIDSLEVLRNKADITASDLVNARNLETEATKLNCADIQRNAMNTVSKIIANNDLIEEFVKTLPDEIKNKTEIKNQVNAIKNTINGYNVTNIILHENDTQAQLEQAEKNVGYQTTLAKAEIAKAWAETNNKLADGDVNASAYNSIIEAVKDGGAYQQSIENNDKIANDTSKSDAERETARKEVERIGVNTELLLVEARLMKALESANTNGNSFKDVSGRKISLSDYQNEINNAINAVKSEIVNFNNTATKPDFKNIAEVVSKIEANLVLQANEKKVSSSTISKRMRNQAKMQIESIYREIENAKRNVQYADYNEVFNDEVRNLIAEFEKTHTSSYYNQIDTLTDVSTFKADAKNIVEKAKAQKDIALQKISENKANIQKEKVSQANRELKQKQTEAKEKIASAMEELKQKYDKLQSDGKLDGLGAKEYENGYGKAGKELQNAIKTFSSDVESINDISKLNQIIAGSGNFAEYFSGLITSLAVVDKRADECNKIVSDWFNGSASNLSKKRKKLEQELGKIKGISDEDKNNKIKEFDSEIENAKTFIEKNGSKFTLEQLQQKLEDATFDEYVLRLVEEAKQQTEQAKQTENEEIPVSQQLEAVSTQSVESVENINNVSVGEEQVKPKEVETKNEEKPVDTNIDAKQFKIDLQKSMNAVKNSIKVTTMGVSGLGKGKEKDVTYTIPPMTKEDKKPSSVKKNSETTRSDAVSVVNGWIAKTRKTDSEKADIVNKFFNEKLAGNYSDEATRTVIALALALQQIDEKSTESDDEREM